MVKSKTGLAFGQLKSDPPEIPPKSMVRVTELCSVAYTSARSLFRYIPESILYTVIIHYRMHSVSLICVCLCVFVCVCVCVCVSEGVHLVRLEGGRGRGLQPPEPPPSAPD